MERILKYIETHISEPLTNEEVVQVKLAERLHNMRTIDYIDDAKKALITGIIGTLFVGAGGVMKKNGNTTVSAIGGVDGPTSVFVAGKLNGDFAVLLLAIGIVLLLIAAIVYLRKKHRKL